MNLLLVEDEPPILRDIQSQLEAFQSESFQIFTAYNGQQALDILTTIEEPIDLLITDIEMPIMNGLELIAAIRQDYPHITCVILSGYSDFIYAKQAIHLGVSEYLLKPVEEELLHTLMKKIVSEKHREYLMQTMKYPPESSLKTDQIYLTAILCIGTLSLHSHECNLKRSIQWQQIELEEKLLQLKSNYVDILLADGKTNAEKNMIFTLYEPSDFHFIQELFQLFNTLPIPISLAYHPIAVSMNEIGNNFHQLRLLLSREIIIGHSTLLLYSSNELSIKLEYAKSLYTFSEDLVALFAQLQVKLFETHFHKMIDLLQEAKSTQHMVFHYLHKLVNDCFELHEMKQELYFDCINFIWDAIALSDSFQELYENMISIFRDMFETICNRREHMVSKEHLMIVMDSYISKHYNQPINAQTLSEEFHFTPAYLSKLFREYRNLSPTEYITVLRIDKAKELFLSDSGMKIREVSSFIGYDNPLYFSRVFKKITGHSPRQFITDSQTEETKNDNTL